MKRTLPEFSAIELCISAFYVYLGFFAVTAVADILASDTLAQNLAVGVAASISLGYLSKSWTEQSETRGHLVNLVLLVAAFFVAIDTAATLAA